VLDGVSAWFDCKMHKTVAAGDHVILIGEVCAFDHTAHPGLGYARGAYVTPSTATQALENAANLVVSALVVRDDEIVLVEDETGALALPQARVGRAGTNRTLNTLLAALELKAEPGFIYSVFEDTERGCQHISYLCPVGAGVPARGRFVALDRVGDHGLTDAAVTSMLARYSAERRLGNFGIYVGTQESGTVRPVT